MVRAGSHDGSGIGMRSKNRPADIMAEVYRALEALNFVRLCCVLFGQLALTESSVAMEDPEPVPHQMSMLESSVWNNGRLEAVGCSTPCVCFVAPILPCFR
jgi:hypothetical protein